MPLPLKLDRISGVSCRNFAAAAFDVTSKHHVSPSIGPALTDVRSASGINNWIVFKRLTDSFTCAASETKVGELSTARAMGMAGWVGAAVSGR